MEKPSPDKYSIVSLWPQLSEDVYSSSAEVHKTHAATVSQELEGFRKDVGDHSSSGEALCFEEHSGVYHKHSSHWDDHNDAVGFIASNHEQVSSEIIRVKTLLRDICEEVTKKADDLYKKADKADKDAQQAREDEDVIKAEELEQEASKLRVQAATTITNGKAEASEVYASGVEGIEYWEIALTTKLDKWGL